MSSTSKAVRRVSPLPFAALAALIAPAGCGSSTPAEAVRPEAPTAAKALGEAAECRSVEQGGEPLIVDWKPEQRGDLEIAMKSGVAVVAYSCEGIKLLPDCKIEGDYGFVGTTRREQLVRLANADEVRANLPMSGAKIGGELERGATIDIAMMIVGKRRTTWATPSRDDLKGSCDGASHFVRGAVVGAFAMTTGTDAKARAAAEIFVASASAASSSSKHMTNRDGDVADCKAATPDSPQAPSQCGAPIRLTLAPLAPTGGSKEPPTEPATPEVPAPVAAACPEGMVLVDGKCAKPPADKPFRCSGKDLAECQTQCEKGSAESCGIAADARVAARDFQSATSLATKGCAADDPRSCGVLGFILANGRGQKADPAAAKAPLEKSCAAGDGRGCAELGRLHAEGAGGTPKDATKGAQLFLKGCEAGHVEGCAAYGRALASGSGVTRDDGKAAAYSRRACDGGLAPACADAGRAYETGAGVGKNEVLAKILYQRGCFRGAASACFGLGRLEFAKNPDAAKRHFESACSLRDTLGCAALKVLYGGTRPVIPSVDLGLALGTSCRSGAPTDCTSAALLDAAKGTPAMAKPALQNACTRGDSFACAVQKKLP